MVNDGLIIRTGWWLLLTPLKNMTNRQLGVWNSQLNGKIIRMFQTTNQILYHSVYPKDSHSIKNSITKILGIQYRPVFTLQTRGFSSTGRTGCARPLAPRSHCSSKWVHESYGPGRPKWLWLRPGYPRNPRIGNSGFWRSNMVKWYQNHSFM